MLQTFVRFACSAFAQYRRFPSGFTRRTPVRHFSPSAAFPKVSAKSAAASKRRRSILSRSESGTSYTTTRVLSGTRREDVVEGFGLEDTKTSAFQLADVLRNVQERILPADSALLHSVWILIF